MINIPVIETSHLILRGHHPDDFVALKEIWEDLEVVKHISGTPSTEQQSWMRLANYLGHWSLMGFGYWGIEEKSSGKYIGEVGLQILSVRSLLQSLAFLRPDGFFPAQFMAKVMGKKHSKQF